MGRYSAAERADLRELAQDRAARRRRDTQWAPRTVPPWALEWDREQEDRDAEAYAAFRRTAFPGRPVDLDAATLGKSVKNVSGGRAGDEELAQRARERASRRERYRLRELMQWNARAVGEARLAWCGVARIDKGEPVTVRRDADGRAHYENLQHCASIWACPVCGAKIRTERAREIDTALRRHLGELHWGDGSSCALRYVGKRRIRIKPAKGSRPGGALFLTLTARHSMGDDLKRLRTSVTNGFRAVLGGRGWLADRERYGVVGPIRSLEPTVGSNGWHPHIHAILLLRGHLTPAEREAFRRSIFGRWSRSLEADGWRAPLLKQQTLDVCEGTKVAAYVTKMTGDDGEELRAGERPRRRLAGLEMARHDLKAGRRKGLTPWQLLQRFGETGDDRFGYLFRQFIRGIKGAQAITWGKGLKKTYGVLERTDEEIANELRAGDRVCDVPAALWDRLGRDGAAAAELLDVAELWGDLGARRYLYDASIIYLDTREAG